MSDGTSRTAVRYLGGPTAVLEVGGLRLLTDPTFDPAGTYPIGNRELTKTADSVVTADELGRVDVVLLSHDQHPDNLDRQGRSYLADAPIVLSTTAAQRRLGGVVQARTTWADVQVPLPAGEALNITWVPALHGPPGCESVVGEVTGFVLTGRDLPSVYVSGDNASLEHVREIADRFGPVDVALLFAGAASTALLDGAHLTLTSSEAARAAEILAARHVVPLHFEGWAHFTQGRDSLVDAFATAGLQDRMHLLGPGERVVL